jgi:hypothetical protein
MISPKSQNSNHKNSNNIQNPRIKLGDILPLGFDFV